MSGESRKLAAVVLLAMAARFIAAQDGGPAEPVAPAPPTSPIPEAPAPRMLPTAPNLYLPSEAAPTAPPLSLTAPGEGGIMPPAPASVPSASASAPGECATPPRNFWQRWRYHKQATCWGFPSQFQRPPLGYFLRAHGQTEVANGTAVRMTLYQYDFVDGSNMLNLHGRDRLAEIAALLPHNFFPLVIERTPGAPELAESRRAAVLHELACGPFPVPAERVIIGPSRGDDLRGVEAELMNINVMTQTRARGIGTVQGGGFNTTGNQRGVGGAAGPGGAGMGFPGR